MHNFVSSSHSCQLRRRLRASDRVPITPIPRATRPFEMVVIDTIGPIEPPAGPQKFKYVLCIVDSFSRFASAYLLKDLTAKSTCQALLEFFSWAGVSSVVISDNGTNFNNSLTKEFMRRMGFHQDSVHQIILNVKVCVNIIIKRSKTCCIMLSGLSLIHI